MFHVEQLNIKVFSLYSPVYTRTSSRSGTRNTSIYIKISSYFLFIFCYSLFSTGTSNTG